MLSPQKLGRKKTSNEARPAARHLLRFYWCNVRNDNIVLYFAFSKGKLGNDPLKEQGSFSAVNLCRESLILHTMQSDACFTMHS